jgi:transposase
LSSGTTLDFRVFGNALGLRGLAAGWCWAPPHLRIHLIIDNGSSHTSAATRAWLAAHCRFAVTCTPKHASWLNMAEQWPGVLTRRLLRRGDFTSRDDLEAKITAFTIRHNKNARPCTWTCDAEHARYLERHPQPDAAPRPAARRMTVNPRQPAAGQEFKTCWLETPVGVGGYDSAQFTAASVVQVLEAFG